MLGEEGSFLNTPKTKVDMVGLLLIRSALEVFHSAEFVRWIADWLIKLTSTSFRYTVPPRSWNAGVPDVHIIPPP